MWKEETRIVLLNNAYLVTVALLLPTIGIGSLPGSPHIHLNGNFTLYARVINWKLNGA